MNVRKITGVVLLAVSFSLLSFKLDKDPLHKKKYTAKAQAVEPKDGTAKGKPIDDEIEFKGGKVYSQACWEKMEFQDVKYEITKDSSYTEEGEEKRYFEVVAITTNEKKETLTMNFTINGYDIEGSYKLAKKDAVKKMFTFTGTEKVKAQKKEKEKK